MCLIGKEKESNSSRRRRSSSSSNSTTSSSDSYLASAGANLIVVLEPPDLPSTLKLFRGHHVKRANPNCLGGGHTVIH